MNVIIKLLAPLLAAALSSCSAGETSQQSLRDRVAQRVFAPNESVRCGHLHRDGSMWFGTNHEGVYRYNGESFVHYSERDGLVSNLVNAITHDRSGNLWFGTDRGLCRFDGESFVNVPIPWDGNEDLWGEGLNANLVISLLCDRRGLIWLGTWGNGVHRFDPAKEISSGHYAFDSFLQDEGATYDRGDHRNAVQSIVEDHAGNVWLTSMSHGGVQQFDGERFKRWSMPEGLSDDQVFSACVDRRGDLWFGMLGNGRGGLDRFDGRSFTHYNEGDGLCSNNVVDIFQDRDGVLWLASQRAALCRLDHGTAAGGGPVIEPFTVDGVAFEQVWFVTEDASGAVWFGGGGGRLFRYAGGRLVDLRDKQ